jgi:hypothetical protein
MGRSGVRWSTAATAIVGLGLLAAFSPIAAATTPASPSPATCGTPVSSWGAASANDVDVALLGVERVGTRSPATPAATPGATSFPAFFAELRIENRGSGSATVTVAEITLDLCDGTSVRATAASYRAPLPDGPLPAGETRTGWIVFDLTAENVPIRLVVPVSRPGLVGGRVEFPLVDVGAGTAVAGASISSGTTGGDAYGGDGANGADATGETSGSGQGS